MSIEYTTAAKLQAEIERLQANLTTAEFDRLANEAEIERLREDNGYTATALGKAEAEIERLRAKLIRRTELHIASRNSAIEECVEALREYCAVRKWPCKLMIARLRELKT